MTQETLREAIRASYDRGYNSVPTIAAMLPDGTPAAHWAGLDAAIATMFERLRTPSEAIGAWLASETGVRPELFPKPSSEMKAG